MRILLLSILLLSAAVAGFAAGPSFVITAFGAKGDGKTMNTRAIQRAVDAAAAAGGGVVVVPSGRFLTGVITLRSGVELHLMASGVLLGTTRRSDYGGERCSALLEADGQQNIAITGSGTIDGQGREVVEDVFRMLRAGTLQDPEWQTENPWHQKRPNERNRPGIIHFVHCTDVRLDSVLIKDAACWVQTYVECVRLTMTNVRVQSTAYWNNDGIDVVDCKDVRIAGCTVNADDDGICLKSSNPASRCERVLIEHCDVRSSASGIKFGTASFGGFKDITIKDVTLHDTYRSALALESVDGGVLENVLVERVRAANTGNALFIRLGHRNQKAPPGIVRHVTIKDLTVEVPAGKPDKGYEMEGPEMGFAPHNPFPSSIVGLPGHPVEDVVLDNVKIIYRSTEDRSLGRYGLDSLAFIPEKESDYPEYSMFGELPAWGLYVRHVDGLQLRQVVLTHEAPRFRRTMVFDDVKGLSLDERK
jgi:polygalacturonase